MASKPPIALLGLGLMGTGMAGRLLDAGFPLTVYNRTESRAKPLRDRGARVATSPADAARDAQIVISMVADDVASRAMWTGENGALSVVKPQTLLIECSTVSVDWIKELANLANQRGCELLDAPVTGSKPQAAAGELNFLVGGSDAAIERARPALEAMGRSIIHLGPTGSGALVKLINNFCCGVQLVSLAEAVTLIERAGLDREKAIAVLTNGSPGSPMFKTLSARMVSREFTPNFVMRLMAKDMSYAIHEGEERGVDLTTAATALAALQKALPKHAVKDMSAIVEMYREQSQ